MIINFEIENFTSYKEKSSLSMVATRERDPLNHLSSVTGFNGRLLPTTAIYGYNACGKTNFLSALLFLQLLVIRRITEPNKLNLQPFAFVDNQYSKPTKFSIQFLSNESVYLYEIEMQFEKILIERLTKIYKTQKHIIFERTEGTLSKLASSFTKEDVARLSFAMQGTAPIQTFLNNCKSQQIIFFDDAYDWFNSKLVIVNSNSNFALAPLKDYPLDEFNDLLIKLDVTNGKYLRVKIDSNALPYNTQYIEMLDKTLNEGHSISLSPLSSNVGVSSSPIIVSKVNGELEFSKVIIRHSFGDGKDADMDLSTESEGTRRLYELRPVLIDLMKKTSDYVFVIDEFDRSLHPMLVRHFIELFNDSCKSENRVQLIFSCHDISLLDQKLMRRDSYWITSKDNQGASSLIRITDLEQGKRTDKVIRNAYMAGELGVKPSFLK